MIIRLQAFNHYGFSPEFIASEGHIYFQQDSPDLVIDMRYNEEPTDDIIGDFNGYHKTFTAEDQLQVLHRVQSAYFISLLIIQGLHIFQVRARTSSIFTRGIFGNVRLLFGICISLSIGLCVTFLHVERLDFIETENPPIDAISYGCLVSFVLLFAFNELRKFILQRMQYNQDLVVDERTGAIFAAAKFADPTNRNHRLHALRELQDKSFLEILISW